MHSASSSFFSVLCLLSSVLCNRELFEDILQGLGAVLELQEHPVLLFDRFIDLLPGVLILEAGEIELQNPFLA